jgi:hypothetical protein
MARRWHAARHVQQIEHRPTGRSAGRTQMAVLDVSGVWPP